MDLSSGSTRKTTIDEPEEDHMGGWLGHSGLLVPGRERARGLRKITGRCTGEVIFETRPFSEPCRTARTCFNSINTHITTS